MATASQNPSSKGEWINFKICTNLSKPNKMLSVQNESEKVKTKEHNGSPYVQILDQSEQPKIVDPGRCTAPPNKSPHQTLIRHVSFVCVVFFV